MVSLCDRVSVRNRFGQRSRDKPYWAKRNFVDSLVDHLSGYKEVLEIPRCQRYVNRPTLETLFEENAIKDKGKRNRRIAQAVFRAWIQSK